jgi:hypothetical protein
MRTFERGEIDRFMGAVDEALRTHETLVLIGGGAVMLSSTPLWCRSLRDCA